MAALETVILPLEYLSAQGPDVHTSLNAAPPGHPAPSQGSKTDTEKGVGLREPGGGKKKQGPVQEETKNTRGKKNRKAKESTRKLFCVSLFLAKWGKICTKERDRGSEGTKPSTERQIHANYLTLLLCGAAEHPGA